MGWIEITPGPNATEEQKKAIEKFNESLPLENRRPPELPDYDYDNRDENGRPRIKRSVE
jgi:hypothetical protein